MANNEPVIGIRWPGDPIAPGGDRVRRVLPPGPVFDAIPAAPGMPTGRRPGFTLRDILALGWHSRRVITGSMAAGLLCGAIVSVFSPRQYMASSLLLSLGAGDAAMQSELSIVGSDDVIHGAVARVGAQRILVGTGWPQPLDALLPACTATEEACAAAVLKAGLESRIEGRRNGEAAGDVLRLTVHHPDADTTVAALDAVIAANRAVRHAAYVTPRAASLAPQLAMAEQAARETMAEAAHIRTAAGVLDIKSDIAAATAEASALARRVSKLRERQTGVEAERQRVIAQLRSTPERVIASREVRSSEGGETTNALLLQLQLDRAHMAALYAPGFAGLVELDRKIAAVVAASQARNTGTVTRDISNPAYEGLQARLFALQAEGEALERQRTELEAQSRAMAARADALRAADAQLIELGQRQQIQESVARQLSVEIATLRTQDTLAAARTDELRVLQRPEASPAPWTGFALYGPAGAALGLLGGLVAAVILSRGRGFYVVAREAERDLALTELGQIRLWSQGSPVDPAGHEISDLASRVLDATDEEAASVATVHLVGTEAYDGAALVARALAQEIVRVRGLRVLMLQLGEDGSWEMQSLGAGPSSAVRSGPVSGGPSGGQLAAPAHAVPAMATAAGMARALFGERQAVDGRLQVEVARLRASHDMVLVVSAHSAAPPVTRRLSALADLDLMVLRSGYSRAKWAIRLRDCLAHSGGRTLGFVFTMERSSFSLRTA